MDVFKIKPWGYFSIKTEKVEYLHQGFPFHINFEAQWWRDVVTPFCTIHISNSYSTGELRSKVWNLAIYLNSIWHSTLLRVLPVKMKEMHFSLRQTTSNNHFTQGWYCVHLHMVHILELLNAVA